MKNLSKKRRGVLAALMLLLCTAFLCTAYAESAEKSSEGETKEAAEAVTEGGEEEKKNKIMIYNG